MNKLQATTIDQDSTLINPSTLEAYIGGFDGELILPGDDVYEDARLVWNGMIDQRPAMIAQCHNEQDVIHAVNFAREHRPLTVIRGGSHNVAGRGSCIRRTCPGLVTGICTANR